MATVLDTSLLASFANIFVWIFVFVVVYGVLQFTNVLKNKGLDALAAIAITLIIVVTGGATSVITSLTPWFVVMIFFAFFLLVLTSSMGVDIKNTPLGGGAAIWILVTPLIIGIIVGVFTVINETPESGEEDSAGRFVFDFLTEPKVLGLILILAISAITVVLMSGIVQNT